MTMKSLVPYFIGLCLMSISSPLLKAQSDSFDPHKLKAEYFQQAKVANGQQFSDQGESYKIKNSNYSKGLYVKHDGRWLKHGAWFNLSSGRVSQKTQYHYGQRHGERINYRSDGQVRQERTYQKGVQTGTEYFYREDGSMSYEVPVVDGKWQGTKIEYHSNGSIAFKKNYKEGKLHGEYLQYNDEGKIVARSQYQNGKQVGKTQWSH